MTETWSKTWSTIVKVIAYILIGWLTLTYMPQWVIDGMRVIWKDMTSTESTKLIK